MLAVAWPISERLSLDRSLERMFPADDPDRLEFERIEERFGVSQFLVFAYRDPELWSSDGSGIDRAMQWRKKIEGIPGVSYALDLSRVDEMLNDAKGTPRSVHDDFNVVRNRQCPFVFIELNIFQCVGLNEGNAAVKQFAAQCVYVHIPLTGTKTNIAHLFGIRRENNNWRNDKGQVSGHLLNCFDFTWTEKSNDPSAIIYGRRVHH